MSMPYICTEPEVNPNEKHNVEFKVVESYDRNDHGMPRYFIEKPACSICGATKETTICNRTIYQP
jgi:hypothetical protein